MVKRLVLEMAELKLGTVVDLKKFSPILAAFRLMPENGSRFPDYKAGQYIALRRENCRLTKPEVDPDGGLHYVPDLDESGNLKLGPVTHSYSISSPPYETRDNGYLEFYIVLERDEAGTPGRLSSSMFQLNPRVDDEVIYVNRIAGSFTLDRRANGFASVLLIGSGTGLAPFVSMIKQLHFDACRGIADSVRYTLIHTNRTYEELAYHQELLEIEAARRFDFLYLPSVSRPTARDYEDALLGRGRANNLLRHIVDMPLMEEQAIQDALAGRGEASVAKAALERTVEPALPRHLSKSELQKRLDPARTVVLTCGNSSLMADIEYVADTCRMRFEKEDW
jgi:ferredoxin-NADP reductase